MDGGEKEKAEMRIGKSLIFGGRESLASTGAGHRDTGLFNPDFSSWQYSLYTVVIHSRTVDGR